ncbi:MAG: flavodoxin domain-containing protein [Hyphomicrobiaceae bacterium]
MTAVLIAFASREGQTRKICAHMARRIERAGGTTQLLDLSLGAPDTDVERCDAALIAGSVHRGRMDQSLMNFLMRNGAAIGRVPSAFVSVSLSAASVDSGARSAIDEITSQLLHDVGWQPDRVLHVAGAVDLEALNLLERCAIHAVMQHRGVALDGENGRTELTDWCDVDRVVDELLGQLDVRRQVAVHPVAE